MNNSMLSINRYGNRNWAVYFNGELLAVTVYKKGAVAVCDALGKALAVAAATQTT